MEAMVLRLALVVLLAVVAGACSNDKNSSAGTSTEAQTTVPPTTTGVASKPTGAERTWVESVGEWALTFGGDLNPIAIEDCPGSLRQQAGQRPSERLTGLEDLALALCRAYRRLSRAGPGRREAAATVKRLETSLNVQLYGFEFRAGPNRPLPVKGGVTEQSRIEPRLSAVLSRLIRTQGEARCWSDADWKIVATHSPYGPRELGGFVDAAGKVQLNPVICRSLAGFFYRGEDSHSLPLTQAVVVFSHESRHAGGEDREDRAECYGMQDARRVARMLGMSAADAGSLAERYWRDVYPTETPPYFSPECRDGGKLDLHPASSVWP
jgi:hypothetical protein